MVQTDSDHSQTRHTAMPCSGAMNVFISSPIPGLQPFREAAARAAAALRHEVKRSEDFGAAADTPQQACLAGVRWADVVVLLLGARSHRRSRTRAGGSPGPRGRPRNEEAEAPPTADDLGKALDHLPVLADRLSDLPQRELRPVFESLQLQIPYQPAAAAVDVEVTLVADERSDLRGGVAEVHSVRRSSSSFEPAERSRVRRSGPKMVRIPRGSGARDASPRQRPRSVWARQRPDGGGGRESNPPTGSRRRTDFEVTRGP